MEGDRPNPEQQEPNDHQPDFSWLGEVARHGVVDPADLEPAAEEEPADQERRRREGETPAIYVAAALAHERGISHVIELDATDDPDDLREAIELHLQSSPVFFESEWVLTGYRGFHGVELDEREDLETIHRIASKLEEHGQAYAAWIVHVGREDLDDLERTFERCYQGTYESYEAWGTRYITETDMLDFLQHAPTGIGNYMTFDYEAYARQELSVEMHVVEFDDGSVAVFDPRG